ncbi:thioredoxin domain-containing protein, partial [Haematococcus lacustris]|uniref:Thioredoxin domain-containing protein n=1 Tax=Haematococcus lacustris TaxID=44745 RepID=A0A699YKZ5_HAELA
MIAPELEKMAEEWGDKVVMSKIDCTTIPENKKWAMGQSVKALPTFLLFKEGKRVNDMTGAKAANLKKLIEAHM